MNRLKKTLSCLCMATMLSLPMGTMANEGFNLGLLKSASDEVLCYNVESKLDEHISGLEKSLKDYIPNVKEIYYGSTVKDEIGIGVKILHNKNTDKQDYYYFLMAVVDNEPIGSDNDKHILFGKVCFSFYETDLLSKLARNRNESNPLRNMSYRGTTFILRDSDTDFYVGIPFYSISDMTNGNLIYHVKIDHLEKKITFKGYANGDISFQKIMSK